MKIKAGVIKIAKRFLLTLPVVKTRVKHYDHLRKVMYNAGYEPGHYYSTVPNLIEIEREKDIIFNNKELDAIDLNTEYQIGLLEELHHYYSEYPYFKNEDFRYKREGAFYRYSDSIFLYCMIRHFKPKKIIEVGSGHSSALMLDTNELFFDNKIEFTFIEPYPEERLIRILTKTDKEVNKIIRDKVQSVKAEEFQFLDENDILFIDSTHVSKVGSDVNYIIFEVLPRLKPGVLIHFHDIFYPFELPKHWILENRWFWNENYLLRAFLMNNESYQIVNFNTYLQKIKHEWFDEEMPECLIGSEDTGSIWLQKIK